MKKILLGFIAIGLLTFVGCDKDDDTDTTDSTETSSDEGSTDTSDDTIETSSDDGSTDTSDDTTDTSSDDGRTDSNDDTTDTISTSSSIKYGEGATDIDGNIYKSVIIGTQEWMAENLRTTKYSDGTVIPNITDDTEWGDLETAAWCHFENDSQYDSTYGRLYNWYAVETGKLCPTGWHVPTDAEWTNLTDYLKADGHQYKEGVALKATSGWDSSAYGRRGTDDYGWNGLPGGYRMWSSSFGGFGLTIGNYGSWWSSSQSATGNAWNRILLYSSDLVTRNYSNKNFGFSVRCLRD